VFQLRGNELTSRAIVHAVQVARLIHLSVRTSVGREVDRHVALYRPIALAGPPPECSTSASARRRLLPAPLKQCQNVDEGRLCRIGKLYLTD
jgi:hypothetical protein